MINLDTSEWKEFKISDLFYCKLSKGDLKENECEYGDINLVSSGSTNNGIVKKIDKNGDGKAEIFKGNCLTVDMFCNCFYQDEDFYSVSHGRVNILIPKFILTRNIGLFISTILNMEQYKFSYGRAVYGSVIENIVVKLPTDNQGIPNWDYMENYIKNLCGGSHYTSIPYSKNDLNINEWKEFEIGKLFKLTKCKCNCASNLEDGKETIYVGAKKNNNGFMKFVKNEPKLSSKGNCLVFICDGEGSVGYSNYLDRDFIGSTTVTCGYNENLNKYIGMFLVTVLDLEKVRYSYGRKYSPTLAKTKIKLPIDSNGNPDWNHMENYIKKLQFSDMI